MAPLDAFPTVFARGYVAGMLAFTGRALAAVCRLDAEARAELAGLPDGFALEMRVLPSGPALRLRKDGVALRRDTGEEGATLSIQFKHLRHALRMLALVDDVGRSIACNRLVIDGELVLAMRFQRIASRLMAWLVPRTLSSAPRAARLLAAVTFSRDP